MEPAAPVPSSGVPSSGATNGPPIDVGPFEQGTQFSRWALARYLVGRAIGASVSRSLWAVTVLALALAVISTWVLHVVLLAVLLVVFAFAAAVLNLALSAVLRRLVAVGRNAPVEQRLRGLVADTNRDVLRELRRVGLPGRTLTLPLLAIRLAGRRRAETLDRLRRFDVERAVPRARLDELHMALRGAGRG